jgi:cellulose synthase/poly-beta-1,6-N-acetylglucosamine synthase-like glycosyltransferase
VTIIETMLNGVAVVLLLPVGVLFFEVLLAVAIPPKGEAKRGERQRLAVLIPAHNEASMIGGTLHSVMPQLAASDRVVVVADNCTDDTASVARAEGAEVIARRELTRRGKGFALDFGVRHLEHDAPAIVIIIDADCRVAPGAIDRLARTCHWYARPVQALYLMHAPPGGGIKMQIAEFAWAVKNKVRPCGLYRLGLPCHLTGSGMAFPWPQIQGANLATGHIVEDLKLGIDLARAGAPPIYCADALITSEFPLSVDGVVVQRTRWEHGHLRVILSEGPRLFWESLTRFNGNLLALALDVTVPPLALLTMLVALTWTASCAMFLIAGKYFAFYVTTAAAGPLALSILFSWLRYGRHIISLGRLCFAAGYALTKIPLYAKFLVARQTAWIRSKREKED